MFALGVLLGTASCAQVLGLDGFEDCDADSCSGALWAKSFESGDLVFPVSARLDSKGDILLSGFFRNTVDFGGSPLISSGMDVFLAKLKPDGSHAFSRRLSVDNSDGIFVSYVSILPDDGIVLSGRYEDGIDLGDGNPLISSNPDGYGSFVAKFLAHGELEWRRNLFTGAGDAFALGLAATPDGDVVLVGSFEGEVNLGSSTLRAAARDAFVVRLDGETGNEQWSRQLGDPEDTMTTATIAATAVAADPDGNIVVGGRFTGSIDSVFTRRRFESPSGAGAFLLKAVSTGDTDWVAFLQGEGDASVSDLDFDARGNVVASGVFSGAISIEARGSLGAHQTSGATDLDLLLLKLSSAGNHLWSLKFGDDSAQLERDAWDTSSSGLVGGPRVAVDAAGDIVLGTGIAGAVDFGGGLLAGRQDSDWVVAKLSERGEHLWSRRFGDPAAGQMIFGIDTDPITKALVVVGLNDGILDFGDGVKVAAPGELSAVVAKIDLERLGR
ncbi:hypothetical protein [Sorangium cellulosum]|uniref:Uncharacterized protein n=1 Tax=Sorangium cellulosum TaxID=56 RepID=A0A150Q7T6_SORCE|nr:hypothetical protein [Sorangium cellulosum]KYF64055.1 hypothetical protein BE15_37930 [Sorangium cellulosum]